MAWGDWDGDGDLDLAFANFGQNNEVYENVEGTFLLDPANGYGWPSTDASASTSLAWGDYDGDGDLDLAFGNEGPPLQLYRNTGGALRLRWESPPADVAETRAWPGRIGMATATWISPWPTMMARTTFMRTWRPFAIRPRQRGRLAGFRTYRGGDQP